ncbi:SpoIIE family protein phosphatase [Motilibacter aurantiacus]|uniref:SpoIIE family protein phosphatase n=1 Tax=Motilibacter aurantiacus TaxID=2714955 RepID=UPI00140D8FE9|nr:SpoIIE family protein phosphatase [Motilibacter aurantiacus]
MANRPTGGDDERQAPPGGEPRPAAGAALPAVTASSSLDRLAALAASLLRAASAHVSVVSDRQVIRGGVGLPAGISTGSEVPLAEAVCALTVEADEALVVTDARADKRVAALPAVREGVVGAYLGVPVRATDGRAIGALCVFEPEPRHWSASDVRLLAQLADSARTELELAALTEEYEATRVMSELAIDAAGIGTFDWDLTTGVLTWDDRLIELFGYDRETFDRSIEGFNARLHPEDLPRVTHALETAIATGGSYEAEYRILLPDHETRWVAARGRALQDERGRTVRVLGAAYDTTSLQEGEARVRRVLEAMTAAFFSLDRDWRFTYVNSQAETLLGRPREELLGGNVWELFPAALGSDFETHYRGAMESGQLTSFEAYYPAPLDAWYEVRAWPGPDGLAVYFHDVTERRTAAEQARDTGRRLQLLAEVTAALAETLDADEAVTRLTQLVVPALGDWCIVTLADDDERAGTWQGLQDVGSWHADPELRAVVARYAQTRLTALTDRSFLAQALRTGRAVSVPSDAAAKLRAVLEPGEARDLVDVLRPESAVVLPLRGRGRTVGLLTLCNGVERSPLRASDIETAKDVASRAGLALDNARLYRQQRDLAEGLQVSMFTDPPEPDHVQVVVRYSPATEAAQVGGDWYDSFLQPDGATVLVIGDVIGHDVAAAAAMGQVRTLLRGIAADSGAGPAEVLRRVDRVMQTLQVGTTATAVVARLEQTPDERFRGVTHLRWSNAGHPPPMVIAADGSVTTLSGAQADLLLGIAPDIEREESDVLLGRRATVLLYTDGLVERRGQSLDDGLSLLRDTLAELATESPTLDELCDRVLARMLPERPEDDVALVAVRLHPQDRPRPVEAGPNRLPPNVAPEPGLEAEAGPPVRDA